MESLFRRHGHFEPNADVFLDEEAGRVVVVVDLAGIDPATVDVELYERRLVVTGRRGDPMQGRRGSYVRKEIPNGAFLKEILLPVAVDGDRSDAAYADGLLTVALPIAPQSYATAARADVRMIVRSYRT
jgi:HSP20 family protein